MVGKPTNSPHAHARRGSPRTHRFPGILSTQGIALLFPIRRACLRPSSSFVVLPPPRTDLSPSSTELSADCFIKNPTGSFPKTPTEKSNIPEAENSLRKLFCSLLFLGSLCKSDRPSRYGKSNWLYTVYLTRDAFIIRCVTSPYVLEGGDIGKGIVRGVYLFGHHVLNRPSISDRQIRKSYRSYMNSYLGSPTVCDKLRQAASVPLICRSSASFSSPSSMR